MEAGKQEAVLAAMRQIHQASLNPVGAGMTELLHPEFTIGSPGLDAPPASREDYVAAIAGFWSGATLVEFRDTHLAVQVTGATAIATLAVELTVDREGVGSRSTWRDVWVFTQEQDRWLAVWRTILDFAETPMVPAAPGESQPTMDELQQSR